MALPRLLILALPRNLSSWLLVGFLILQIPFCFFCGLIVKFLVFQGFSCIFASISELGFNLWLHCLGKIYTLVVKFTVS